jgi:hypothetical protein
VKRYQYVGPEDILIRAALPGAKIEAVRDLEEWLHLTRQKPNRDGRFVVTFVVDEQASLRAADRGSEHVACAAGEPVLSAGDMFLLPVEDGLRVEEVSNQSTGYCPEPESWSAVATALDRIGLPHPARFTQEIVFRRCPACGERSIVKDGWFVCGRCGADLPAAWNF